MRNLNFIKMRNLNFTFEETEAKRGKVTSEVTLPASTDLGLNPQSDARGSNQRLPRGGSI